MTRRFFAITLFAACVMGLCAASLPARASDFTDHFTLAKPPILVPSFFFEDAKGRELDLRDFRGHYVLLNLWATWCGPCVREMPALDALAEKFAADSTPPETKPITISTSKADTTTPYPKMEIIALTEDHEGLGAAESFYKRHNLRHLAVFVDTTGSAPSILEARGLPTTLLIDPRGMEIGRIEGATDWNDPETIAFLKAQMKPVTK